MHCTSLPGTGSNRRKYSFEAIERVGFVCSKEVGCGVATPKCEVLRVSEGRSRGGARRFSLSPCQPLQIDFDDVSSSSSLGRTPKPARLPVAGRSSGAISQHASKQTNEHCHVRWLQRLLSSGAAVTDSRVTHNNTHTTCLSSSCHAACVSCGLVFRRNVVMANETSRDTISLRCHKCTLSNSGALDVPDFEKQLMLLSPQSSNAALRGSCICGRGVFRWLRWVEALCSSSLPLPGSIIYFRDHVVCGHKFGICATCAEFLTPPPWTSYLVPKQCRCRSLIVQLLWQIRWPTTTTITHTTITNTTHNWLIWGSSNRSNSPHRTHMSLDCNSVNWLAHR